MGIPHKPKIVLQVTYVSTPRSKSKDYIPRAYAFPPEVAIATDKGYYQLILSYYVEIKAHF